ncbi:MAG: adenosine deaminase family protein [Proteobacteria bacterium]|nr:adenosine deaminase family protein [Pseudomonadota bacterium]
MGVDIKNLEKLKAFIRKLPKTDLHVHLDGSIRLETLIEISERDKLPLPSYTVDGMNEKVFKEQYKNLEEYLKTFGFSCAVMQKPEDLERISYEFAIDNQKEGVCYVETRFAPQLLINKNQNMKDVFVSINAGMARAQKEYNKQPEVISGEKPAFFYGLIACAMRNFGPYSEYYESLINIMAHSNRDDVVRLASMELAKAVVQLRDETNIPIVAFDLAGEEAGYPAKDHWQAYQYVHENFMHKTVHAGEAYGPESIFQAITELHADRIGHGYYLFDSSKISDPRIVNKKKYISDLCQYIANRRITIEVCLTSNLQTNPAIKNLEKHNFNKMLQNKLSTTFCTDNRTVSKTTVTDEICRAINTFGLSQSTLRDCITYGFKRSFFPGEYLKKNRYVRQCIDYHDGIVKNEALSGWY